MIFRYSMRTISERPAKAKSIRGRTENMTMVTTTAITADTRTRIIPTADMSSRMTIRTPIRMAIRMAIRIVIRIVIRIAIRTTFTVRTTAMDMTQAGGMSQ